MGREAKELSISFGSFLPEQGHPCLHFIPRNTKLPHEHFGSENLTSTK
jgi:hypothetical protein